MTKKIVLIILALFMNLAGAISETPASEIKIAESKDAVEVERLIKSSIQLPVSRRIEFISKYLLGRKYRKETRARLKKQKAARPAVKVEATNAQPLPVKILKTSMTYLDCMTYVEHVLAIAAASKADYQKGFLCRLIDVVFNANGQPLMSHHRNHFTSAWGDVNERKGYVKNMARNHPLAVMREVHLNRVGKNRTFYVEDRFMIAGAPQQVWFFPRDKVLEKRVPLASGDVVAMVTDKEGLDVTHMGFYIERNGKKFLRHASLKLNRVVDQDFYAYIVDGKSIRGLMVFRPLLNASPPPQYRFNFVRGD